MSKPLFAPIVFFKLKAHTAISPILSSDTFVTSTERSWAPLSLKIRLNDVSSSNVILGCLEVCHDVFFKKGWHKPGSTPLQQMPLSGKGVHFALCPACKMKKGNLFGGKISIKNIPIGIREELFNLISGFGKRAESRNPQDRIMDIKTQGGNFIVTTNNDQLAVKIGRKINDTFHKTDKKVVFSAEPQEVSYVEITFS